MATPVPAIPRYVELVRVSSLGQAARDTPADQRAALERLRFVRPGILVERIELQVSGAAAGVDRPDLNRLAELAALKAFDEVRVRHLDRLTRHEDPLERAAVLSMVSRAGAVIVDAGGTVLDPKTMGGELVWVVSTLASAEERRKILERTQAAKKRLAAEGRLVAGMPPWGRTFDRKTGRWGTDPDAMVVYRRLFDLILAGRTLRQIADTLNGEGVTTKTGRQWTAGTVHNALHAPHASGQWRTHGAEMQIPMIVDRATQAEALARLRANDGASGRHNPAPALLRKRIFCGVCGAACYTSRSSGRLVYYCHTRGECSREHGVELVDKAVQARLEAWLGSPGPLSAAAAYEPREDPETAAGDADAARHELEDLDRQEERLARLARRGLLSSKVHDSQLTEVGRLRAAAERRLEEAEARGTAAERRAEASVEFEARIAEIRAGLGRAGFAEWRELVEILFPRDANCGVMLYPDGRLELRGALSLDGAAVDALSQGARELSGPSRTR